jgi:hypothetical protein
LKKKTETEPKRNRVKPTGFVSVRFGFLGKKPVQTGFGSVFSVWLGFLGFGSVFSVNFGSVFSDFGLVFFGLARFFSGFLSVSVRFGFFGFLVIKPKPNRTGWFFQKFNRFNRFFFGSVFSVIFFLVFSV